MNEKQQKKCAITCFAWNMVAQISFSINGKKILICHKIKPK